MDEVFRALADPSRRRLLDALNEHNGQTLRELCAGLAMARQSVSKHLAILEAADLVTTRRRGREKLHFLNAAPIDDIAERWIGPYRHHARALTELRHRLEDDAMPENTTADFVYATYIRTTPERLWAALTEPEFTQQYWDTTFETDWAVGSAMAWHHHGTTITDPEQKVLEYDPYRRLAYAWHTFTPGWRDAVGFDAALHERIAAEPRTHVAFDIEDLGDKVRLTVTHGGFVAGSAVKPLLGEGWPHVLADLKTLLETGTLPNLRQQAATVATS
jgi:DNA-binding transcriptional ArsR family regulator/uncharacterized protein YndB with AHSA1/START domain